jgi:EmrB/QacA subfamily drug resistance transporter
MQQHIRVLLLVATGVFMSTLDSSMLNVALPSIMEAFDSSLALTEWVIMIYLLTITVTLLFWGQLSKKYNQGTIFTSGVLIFAFGSLLCSLSTTVYLLIFFRFIQAVGASMMMSMGPAIIKSAFPPDHLGKGLGQIGIATSIGLMAGPPISGILIRWSDWRFIFLLTVPVGFAVFLLGRKLLIQVAKQHKSENILHNHFPFDHTGALLWATAVSLTLFLTSHATVLCCSNQKNPFLPLYIAGAAASWLLLFFHEQRRNNPLLPLKLFTRRFFSMAMLTAMLSFCVLFFVLLLTPFFLRSVQQMAPDRTGYVMMALPLCVFFVSPAAGILHDRIGARIVSTLGLSICLAALLLMTTIKAETSPWMIAAWLAMLGFGQAMFLSPNSAAALAGVDHEQAGVTASLLATARNMGMLIGTALAGLIFSLYFSRLTGGLDLKDFTPEYTEQFMIALQRALEAAAVLAATGVAASWWRGNEKKEA